MAGEHIQAQVRRLSKEKAREISEAEIFGSPEFASYTQKLTNTITGKYDIPITVNCSYSNEKVTSSPAYTDWKMIMLECNNDITEVYEDIYSKFMCLLGILFHENAHVLFANFEADERAKKSIALSSLYPGNPETRCAEDDEYLKQIQDALQNKLTHPIFIKVYSDLCNIIDDAHDEDKLCDRFGGFIHQGITFSRQALWMRMEPLEKLIANTEARPLSIMYGLILEFARFGEISMLEPETTKNHDYYKAVTKVSLPVEIARATDDPELKYEQINKILLALWPYIRDTLDNTQHQQSQNSKRKGSAQGDNSGSTQSAGNDGTGGNASQKQSSSPNAQSSGTQHSAEAVQQVLNELGKSTQGNSPLTVAPQNRKSSKEAKAAAGEAKKDGASHAPKIKSQANTKKNSIEVTKDDNAALEQLISAIATHHAEAEVEAEMKSSMNAIIQGIEMNSTHRGRKTVVVRALTVTAEDKARYDNTMREISSYSKRLQKQMSDALRDIRESTITHKKPYGNKFEARNAYRLDQCYYAQKSQPQDVFDMAISVLVDHSGSMKGERIKYSMMAAMLLYDFANGLGIPVAVAGHHTTTGGIRYHVYSDYDGVGKNDAYRLAKMTAAGYNRDGMAIEVASHLLCARPESHKLLFVISDGQPNDDGYRGDAAAEDIRSVVKKYKKRGIETLAAAIGSDKERVKGIYVNGCLDISDLSTLPKAIVSVVKKRVLRNI